MKIAEQVTFGGSGLNRAAELRGKPEDMARLLADETARGLPIWRGKPLFSVESGDRPGWLPMDHPVFSSAVDAPVFLGLDQMGPRFGFDISQWEPEELPDTSGAFFDPSQHAHPDLPGDHRFAELRGVMTQITPREAELVATAKAVLSWHQTHGFCAKCGAKSVIAMSGWQRDCPACGAHHFPRTDPVVIMLITRGNSVLVGVVLAGPRACIHCWQGSSSREKLSRRPFGAKFLRKQEFVSAKSNTCPRSPGPFRRR